MKDSRIWTHSTDWRAVPFLGTSNRAMGSNGPARYEVYCKWCREVIGCEPAPMLTWIWVLDSMRGRDL